MHPKGTNIMAESGLSFRKTLVGTGWAISPLLCTNRLRKQPSWLVGPCFLAVKLFPSLDEQLTAKSSEYWKFINGWVWFELWTCRRRLQGNLCEVWRRQTWHNWGYGKFNACIGQKWPPEKNNLSRNGLSTENLWVTLECMNVIMQLTTSPVLSGF